MLRNAVLRMREARFSAPGGRDVGPVSFDLADGERLSLDFATIREASVTAMLAAAIVKPTTGGVLIESFDSRVQPAACKRIAGFVPHDPLPLTRERFDDFIAYRAELWGLEPRATRARATLLLAQLAGVHEAFAYPLIGALVAAPRLLVFDRPQATFMEAFYRVATDCAVLCANVAA